MSSYLNKWKKWYDAQLQEISHRIKYRSDERPTLFPTPSFDPAEDAAVLRKAMKGLGTTEEDIIKILTRRTLAERLEIQSQYQQIHERDLVEDLKEELNGIFERVIMSLMKPLPLFLAEQVNKASDGAGTDEGALIQIFCTRDDASLTAIKESFEKEYEKSIEEVVCKETSGNFEKILVSILSFCRGDSESSPFCKEDSGFDPSEVADELCNAEVDEDTIRRIATSYNFEFLNRVFQEYAEKSGEDFMQLVENKCSEDTIKAFRAIYLCSKDRLEYFAHALHEAMEGVGTDDWALIKIIVSRCEIDLGSIQKKYEAIFELDLVEQIQNEISGDYEDALLGLLGVPPEQLSSGGDGSIKKTILKKIIDNAL